MRLAGFDRVMPTIQTVLGSKILFLSLTLSLIFVCVQLMPNFSWIWKYWLAKNTPPWPVCRFANILSISSMSPLAYIKSNRFSVRWDRIDTLPFQPIFMSVRLNLLNSWYINYRVMVWILVQDFILSPFCGFDKWPFLASVQVWPNE